MQLLARFQTVVSLVEQIVSHSSSPADFFLNKYFRTHRFIGSKDRQSISFYVYSILRYYASFFILKRDLSARMCLFLFLSIHEKKSIADLAFLFKDSSPPYDMPSPNARELELIFSLLTAYNLLKPLEKEGVQPWICTRLGKQFDTTFLLNLFRIMNKEATLDIRVNTLKTNVTAVLEHFKEYFPSLTPFSSYGVRFLKRFNIVADPWFKEGYIELQDEGSQLVALACDVKFHERVFDLCAGAGGKTLALSAFMHNKGKIIASDIYKWRLDKAKERLNRAQSDNVEIRCAGDSGFNQWLKKQEEKFDCVLIDAPCTGSGTWRRHPEMKFRLQENDLFELVQMQRLLLQKAAALVKKGGRLVYATCSLFQEENQEQEQWFLKEYGFYEGTFNQRFKSIPSKSIPSSLLQEKDGMCFVQLNPFEHQTDGFFFFVAERI